MTSSPADTYDRLWDSREYLRQYYSIADVADDEAANIVFARRRFAEVGTPFLRAIEVGCGADPTSRHVARPHVGTLDLADYALDNLAEVHKALGGAPEAHD